MVRWLALRLANVIRLLSVVAIAVGLGLGVADYANGEFMMQLLLYGLLPAAAGMLVAERLTRFGNYVDENEAATDIAPPTENSR
jgi:hypothetical protein